MPRRLEDRLPDPDKEYKCGKPTYLTPEVQTQIVNALRLGAYHETAAGIAGIHVSTLRDWLRRGARERRRLREDSRAKPRKKEKVFAEFSEACEKASANSELGDLAVIARASSKQWQAAAWRLERKYPERYALRNRHEITGSNGGPLQVVTEIAFVGRDPDDADDQE